MSSDQLRTIANKYRLEDMDGSLIPSSRLSNILNDLELDKKINNSALEFLLKNKLFALNSYAKKEISFNDYSEIARAEQSLRILESEKIEQLKKIQKIKEDEYSVAEMKKAFDNYSQKKNSSDIKNALKDKYGISGYIDTSDYSSLMAILRTVDNGLRLTEIQYTWLSTEGGQYFTDALRKGHHLNEAVFYKKLFLDKNDPWNAFSASSHFRKGGEPESGELLLGSIDPASLKNQKLKSALHTTAGAVKRSLKKWTEAISCGEIAHGLAPKEFHPCTLLGAVHIEIGDYDLGCSWYKKAVERGFKEDDVDRELISIYRHAEKSRKVEMRAYLLRLDPDRYSWTNQH